MISDKKLLCAFIYSAYASGYCGLALGKNIKREHMDIYSSYIANENYFPQKEINETQKQMMDEAFSTSVREYVYNSHNDVVIKRITDTTSLSLKESLKGKYLFIAANLCPVNFYEIADAKDLSLTGVNLANNTSMTLKRINGLEIPKKGDIVSAHWGYLLEVVNEWKDYKKYLDISINYHKNLPK